jgi:hypothetical protein
LARKKDVWINAQACSYLLLLVDVGEETKKKTIINFLLVLSLLINMVVGGGYF